MAPLLRPKYTRGPMSADSVTTTNSLPDSTAGKTTDHLDPFATPVESHFVSRIGSLEIQHPKAAPQAYFYSRRVKKGSVVKPWTSLKDPREKWVTIIPIIGMLIGLGISALFVWDGLKTVVNHTYCPIIDDTFATGLDPSVWTREAEVGGFGNGQFEQTTSTEENVFVRDSILHIQPTIQDPEKLEDGAVIDLRDSNICTSPLWSNCLATTNTTNNTIVPPIKSGRLNAKLKPIRYGRIEVTAKLPRGDWLWPAIWLLPLNDTYGPWPASGEIDIVESRGNNHTYRQGGNNIMSSALHWGPNSANDAWWRTNNKRNALHTTFSDKFHTFGLEWSEKYIFTYINSRLLQVMYVNFDTETSLWERGRFPKTDAVNGTVLVDPWSTPRGEKDAGGGNPSTPFDQPFYLILNVAVGGTNGWFEDGKSGKPWVDSSRVKARKQFWDARESWMGTWGWGSDGKELVEGQGAAMLVSRVRIWQEKGWGGF